MQDTKRTIKYCDPKVRLHAALKTIETFTKHNSTEQASSIHFVSKKEKKLPNIFVQAKNFIAATFSQKIRKRSTGSKTNENDDVKRALDDVKRFHPIIFQKQTEDAKILTQRIQKTLTNYNNIFQEDTQQSFKWHERLLKFSVRRNRSSLAKTHSVKLPKQNRKNNNRYSLKNNSPRMIEVLSHIDKQVVPNPLFEREADAFRMKIISSMKNYSALFPSFSHMMHSIRETPIYSAVTTSESDSDICKPTIITLEQTLTPFPGETLILKLSFKRDPKALTPTTPLPDSFKLITESIQTGFPHPSQNNGWALSDPLIPPYPLRPECFDNLSKLLERKETIAHAFLNKTDLLKISRSLWHQKIDSSRAHKEEFLSLHMSLSKAILSAAPRKLVPQNSLKIINLFYTWLEKKSSPLSTLSTTHCKINTLYIDEPVMSFLDSWLNQTSKDLFKDEPRKRYESAKKIILKQISIANEKSSSMKEEKIVLDYIDLFGSIIGISCADLFLQYFSETLESPPPQLSEFQKRLQTAALVQQERFFIELDLDTADFSFSQLKDSLIKDISIFRKESLPHPLCVELENYYTSRYVNSNMCILKKESPPCSAI